MDNAVQAARIAQETAASNVGYALLMTLLAGMATGIGAAVAFLARRTNQRFLAVSLGLSAGVMIYVSFVELLDLAGVRLDEHFRAAGRPGLGGWVTQAAFFGGIALAGLIDRLVPAAENPHEIHRVEEMDAPGPEGAAAAPAEALRRMGVLSALAIAIHNFPEGLATFSAARESAAIGWPVAAAVAIHNIPEGIAVSVPLFYAAGSRGKAFFWASMSGLAEPCGALLGWLVLMPFFTPLVSGMLFALVAGIMVFISLDELLPAAQAYGEHHAAIWGLVAGMGIMAASLLLFS